MTEPLPCPAQTSQAEPILDVDEGRVAADLPFSRTAPLATCEVRVFARDLPPGWTGPSVVASAWARTAVGALRGLRPLTRVVSRHKSTLDAARAVPTMYLAST